ncbi:MAG: hypothetical protein C3F17_12745 [Bradyrhizobiaceae bacterium]|nr:MAG: hypothetical protein C3F17_12745 [Bradyrhizobiaceae bacterium]
MRLARRDETITLETAFHALHYYAAALAARIPSSGDLAALAGETAILPDGGPADPAAWSDFLEAVDRARGARPDFTLVTR